MPSIRQVGQQDSRMARDAMREVSAAIEEQIQVKKWTGKSGGNQSHGVAATDTYQTLYTRGNVSQLSEQDIFYSASVYQAGDLRIELRMRVFGAIAVTGEDGQTAPRKSDQVVWRGKTYYFPGRVDYIQANGRAYWAGAMRPVGT